MRDAEEALIGSILLAASEPGDMQVINELRSYIAPMDFNDERLRRFYKAMLDCSLPPHQINVAQQLHVTGQLQSYDCSHLCHLIAECPTWLDYMHYAKVVKDFSVRRNGLKAVTHSIEAKPQYKDCV
jgi:replicative DNA helicase